MAIAAAGIGASFSDIMTGCAVYALPTFIIKSAMALCFSSAGKKIIIKRNIAAMFVAGAIDTGGYYFVEVLLYHNFITPLSSVPAHLVKDFSNFIIYLLLGSAFDRLKIKKSINKFVN